MSHKVLIIGVGSEYRHDDAVGLIVARHLRERNLDSVEIVEMSGEGTALMEAWKGAERVILIDAVQSGAQPGTIYRFEAHQQPVPTELFRYSTHSFGVAEAIELARALGQLPQELIVYGIEGENFEAGVGLSPEVERAVHHVASAILQDRSTQQQTA